MMKIVFTGLKIIRNSYFFLKLYYCRIIADDDDAVVIVYSVFDFNRYLLCIIGLRKKKRRNYSYKMN